MSFSNASRILWPTQNTIIVLVQRLVIGLGRRFFLLFFWSELNRLLLGVFFILDAEVVVIFSSQLVLGLRSDDNAAIFFIPFTCDQSLSIDYQLGANHWLDALHHFDLKNRSKSLFFLRN